mgnify:CR=1 FL=1
MGDRESERGGQKRSEQIDRVGVVCGREPGVEPHAPGGLDEAIHDRPGSVADLDVDDLVLRGLDLELDAQPAGGRPELRRRR